MELRDYIRVLRKGWIWILVLAVVGAGAALGFSLLKTPTYTAESKVFVNTTDTNSTDPNALNSGNTFTQQRVTTYAQLVQTPKVLLPVIQGLNLDISASDLAKQVSGAAPLNTTILEITAQADTAQGAADIANSTASSLTTQVAILETSDLDNGVSPVKLTTVQNATVPLSPSSPKIPLNVALGLLVGLVLGIAVAVLRETLDTRIRAEYDIEQVTDAPVVGGITFDAKASEHPLIVHDEPFSVRAEAYRTLRTNLQFLGLEGDVEGRGKSFVITSSLPQEGKSTTSANLGLALADATNRVLLVEADLRRPKLATYLGIEGAAGLTDVLVGRVELDDVVQKWADTELYVLPAGRIPPNPSELLGSTRMGELVDLLSSQFDYVLFDAPPLLPVTDAAILAKVVTGAIIVAAASRTHKGQFKAAIGHLVQVGAPIAGIVMTMLPTKGPDSYYGGYGRYGYARYGYVGEGYHSDAQSA